MNYHIVFGHSMTTLSYLIINIHVQCTDTMDLHHNTKQFSEVNIKHYKHNCHTT